MSATRTDVRALIEAKVDEITNGGEDAVLATEAQSIVEYVRRIDPDALIDWFSAHAVGLIREQLQTRLAVIRRGARAGVFSDTPQSQPFERRYAVEGNVWRRIGDMQRPDWIFLAEERASHATASLFDIALARQVAERLPDDITPTHAVLSEVELLRLEAQSQITAERAVTHFRA